MRTIVFNGWAAGPETWELCKFPRDWVFDYLEELDGLPERILDGFDEFVLVGFSMGGNYALKMLLKYPEKVRGLVLVSATPRMTEERESGWRGLSERRVEALRLGTEMVFHGNPSPLYEHANLCRGLDYLRSEDHRAALKGDPRLHAPEFLKVPVFVFQSERDGIVRPDNAAWLKDVFPQAKVTMVPGNEHALPIKIPELIDDALQSILGFRPSPTGMPGRGVRR